jgi:ectoine hydroxylase-related dioxygenase (phytanoyl-CoA dioxygenase family)
MGTSLRRMLSAMSRLGLRHFWHPVNTISHSINLIKDNFDGRTNFFGQHAYAVDVSGYTIMRNQVSAAELDAIRTCVERAFKHANTPGMKLKHTSGTEYYQAMRCLYCWGEPCQKLLEHNSIHGLATKLMGTYHLWDMVAMNALPTPSSAVAATTSWHRDMGALMWGTQLPAYLWFFLCLDDMTPENGGTWVVPGSHRVPSVHEQECGPAWSGDNKLDLYPSRVQLAAKAGDILVVNPTALHTSGRNSTKQGRVLLNIGICHASVAPLMDHWAIAGPDIRQRASPTIRNMLGANRQPLDTTWSILPPGWNVDPPSL